MLALAAAFERFACLPYSYLLALSLRSRPSRACVWDCAQSARASIWYGASRCRTASGNGSLQVALLCRTYTSSSASYCKRKGLRKHPERTVGKCSRVSVLVHGSGPFGICTWNVHPIGAVAKRRPACSYSPPVLHRSGPGMSESLTRTSTSTSKSRQKEVNGTSTRHQKVVNETSTARQRVVNRSSTNRQQKVFLVESGETLFLAAINGSYGVFWRASKRQAGPSWVSVRFDGSLNSAGAARSVLGCCAGRAVQGAQRERNGSINRQVGCVPGPSEPRSGSQVRCER